MIDKLSKELKFHWGSLVEPDDCSDLNNLDAWLQERTRVLGNTLSLIPLTESSDEKKSKTNRGKSFVILQSVNKSKESCDGDCKSLQVCPEFLEDELPERWNLLRIRTHKL